MRLRLLLPLVCLLLSLSACDDAPGLGIGVVGEPGGVPQGVRVPVATVTTYQEKDLTAGSAALASSTPVRVPAGLVQDPSLGTIAAHASVEVGVATGTTLASFRTKAIDKVTLTVPMKRYYGDTTSAVTFELRALDKELASLNVASDSLLPTTGGVLATATLARRDTVLTLTLPAAWVTANTARLRAKTDSLAGFTLTPTTGGQIRSVPFSGALLTAIAGADTARYAGTLGHARIVRTGTPALATGERLLQDGFPTRLAVPFDTTGMGSAALARVSLVVPYDTTRIVTPAGFLRPPLTVATLYGLDSAGTVVAFNNVPFGRAVPVKGQVVFTSEPLRRIFQDRKLGRGTRLRELTFYFDVQANGLAALIVQSAGTARPYFVFTTVGT